MALVIFATMVLVGSVGLLIYSLQNTTTRRQVDYRLRAERLQRQLNEKEREIEAMRTAKDLDLPWYDTGEK